MLVDATCCCLRELPIHSGLRDRQPSVGQGAFVCRLPLPEKFANESLWPSLEQDQGAGGAIGASPRLAILVADTRARNDLGET